MKYETMKNAVIEIKRQKADPIAERYFNEICGFNRDAEKYRSKLLDGLAVRDKISDSINVRAVVSTFSKDAIRGKTAYLDDIGIECNALSNVSAKSIQGIFAFVMTAGNVELQDVPMLDMFYADTWGTAYVDAGRDILKALLLEVFEQENTFRSPLFISDCMGPGFYGMDVSEVRNFSRVLDSAKIGVRMTDSSMMLPQKSIAGLYLVVDDEAQLPEADCKGCMCNIKGCRFCRLKTREKS